MGSKLYNDLNALDPEIAKIYGLATGEKMRNYQVYRGAGSLASLDARLKASCPMSDRELGLCIRWHRIA
jgi:hypothetical protein